MTSWETLAAFALALGIFACMPGPATLYAAARTLAHGRSAGFMAVAGLHLGGYVHVAATVLGLSALLVYVPPLYTAIKLAGAAYLVWLGIAMIRAPGGVDQQPDRREAASRHAFRQSIVVEILNPKAALFFLAFLPQFADPAAAWPVPVQLALLGFLTLLAFTSADIVTVLLASAIVKRARSSGLVPLLMNRLGGAVMIGLGVRLMLESEK